MQLLVLQKPQMISFNFAHKRMHRTPSRLVGFPGHSSMSLTHQHPLSGACALTKPPLHYQALWITTFTACASPSSLCHVHVRLMQLCATFKQGRRPGLCCHSCVILCRPHLVIRKCSELYLCTCCVSQHCQVKSSLELTSAAWQCKWFLAGFAMDLGCGIHSAGGVNPHCSDGPHLVR